MSERRASVDAAMRQEPAGAGGLAGGQGRALNSSGLTSVVVVFVLVVLLSLLSIGFTRVVNRSQQESSANQQATAANYAAQSGINDAITHIHNVLKDNPSATVSATKCEDLLKAGAPLENSAKLDNASQYSCVLIDSTPDTLFYQNLTPYKSQIVKINASAPLSNLLFSWEAATGENNKFVPADQGQTLFDETAWSNAKYAPLLRLTLYPIPANGNLTGVQEAAKTVFLYPKNAPGATNSLAYGSLSGIQSVNCPQKSVSGFSGTEEYDCNVAITGLPAAGHYYARFSPYYSAATVQIKGSDASGNGIKFVKVQSVIDVTAKSGNSTKRLQARADISSAGIGTNFGITPDSDSIPEFALHSASALCKRLIVPPSTAETVKIDSSIRAACPDIIIETRQPTVTTLPATNISQNSATLNGRVNSNGLPSTYYFEWGREGQALVRTSSASLPGDHALRQVSASISGLSQKTSYRFRIVASNSVGASYGTFVTFTTDGDRDDGNNSESCGNGEDDDGDGQKDENCVGFTEEATASGPPNCVIYDFANRWGDCDAGHEGGQWQCVNPPNTSYSSSSCSCIQLGDYNYAGLSIVTAGSGCGGSYLYPFDASCAAGFVRPNPDQDCIDARLLTNVSCPAGQQKINGICVRVTTPDTENDPESDNNDGDNNDGDNNDGDQYFPPPEDTGKDYCDYGGCYDIYKPPDCPSCLEMF